MKIKLLFLIMVFPIVCLAQQSLNAKVKAQRLRLRNYAFCSCIYHLDTTKTTEIINDGSKAGYFETSEYQLRAYQIIDSLATKYALKKYQSINHKSLGLMKCLDFYNSKELENKIRSLDRLIIRH